MPVAPLIEEPAPASPFTPAAILDRQSRGATMRVLHVINGEHYAGAERVQDLLALRLPECGVEVGFACLKPDRFASMRQSRAAPLFELPMRTRFDLRPAIRLARLLRRDNYDLLHTHTARALLIARFAAALAGTPIVHHVHGHTSSEIAGRPFTRLNAWAERRSLSAAAAVIAVSGSVAEYLRAAGVAEERLHTIANGVPAPDALSVKDRDPAVWMLGFIALLRPRKGLETFLESAAQLKSRGVALRLLIVGRFETPQYEREIHCLAHKLGLADQIDWRGFQQRVDAELAAMDVLAFPSVLPEGMPMVLLEAMAAGVPIVGSRAGGITDVIRDGQDGLLVSPGDAAALAGAVRTLIDHAPLRERLRTTAFARQREQFSDTNMAAAVADIYSSISSLKGRST